MRDQELRNLVDEVLYLVEVGSDSELADLSELEHLLDRLALAMRHLILSTEPETPPEIPERDFAILQKVVQSRFPSLGSYNRPASLIDDIGRTKLEIGSAIDDIAKIADHLHAAAWLWRSASWDLGVWYLQASHAESWGNALRNLQLYLHVRAARAGLLDD